MRWFSHYLDSSEVSLVEQVLPELVQRVQQQRPPPPWLVRLQQRRLRRREYWQGSRRQQVPLLPQLPESELEQVRQQGPGSPQVRLLH